MADDDGKCCNLMIGEDQRNLRDKALAATAQLWLGFNQSFTLLAHEGNNSGSWPRRSLEQEMILSILGSDKSPWSVFSASHASS